jgi:hypothetical protein
LCFTWLSYRSLQANQKAWMSDPLESIDGEAVEKDVALAYKVLYKMGKVRRSNHLATTATLLAAVVLLNGAFSAAECWRALCLVGADSIGGT